MAPPARLCDDRRGAWTVTAWGRSAVRCQPLIGRGAPATAASTVSRQGCSTGPRQRPRRGGCVPSTCCWWLLPDGLRDEIWECPSCTGSWPAPTVGPRSSNGLTACSSRTRLDGDERGGEVMRAIVVVLFLVGCGPSSPAADFCQAAASCRDGFDVQACTDEIYAKHTDHGASLADCAEHVSCPGLKQCLDRTMYYDCGYLTATLARRQHRICEALPILSSRPRSTALRPRRSLRRRPQPALLELPGRREASAARGTLRQRRSDPPQAAREPVDRGQAKGLAAAPAERARASQGMESGRKSPQEWHDQAPSMPDRGPRLPEMANPGPSRRLHRRPGIKGSLGMQGMS